MRAQFLNLSYHICSKNKVEKSVKSLHVENSEIHFSSKNCHSKEGFRPRHCVKILSFDYSYSYLEKWIIEKWILDAGKHCFLITAFFCHFDLFFFLFVLSQLFKLRRCCRLGDNFTTNYCCKGQSRLYTYFELYF